MAASGRGGGGPKMKKQPGSTPHSRALELSGMARRASFDFLAKGVPLEKLLDKAPDVVEEVGLTLQVDFEQVKRAYSFAAEALCKPSLPPEDHPDREQAVAAKYANRWLMNARAGSEVRRGRFQLAPSENSIRPKAPPDASSTGDPEQEPQSPRTPRQNLQVTMLKRLSQELDPNVVNSSSLNMGYAQSEPLARRSSHIPVHREADLLQEPVSPTPSFLAFSRQTTPIGDTGALSCQATPLVDEERFSRQTTPPFSRQTTPFGDTGAFSRPSTQEGDTGNSRRKPRNLPALSMPVDTLEFASAAIPEPLKISDFPPITARRSISALPCATHYDFFNKLNSSTDGVTPESRSARRQRVRDTGFSLSQAIQAKHPSIFMEVEGRAKSPRRRQGYDGGCSEASPPIHTSFLRRQKDSAQPTHTSFLRSHSDSARPESGQGPRPHSVAGSRLHSRKEAGPDEPFLRQTTC